MSQKKIMVFTGGQMLGWMGYISEHMDISPEKIKMLNTCSKRRNILATISSYKRVLIFADESHRDLFYKCWLAGYGDYDVWVGYGLEPKDEMRALKIRDLVNEELTGPTVIYIVNEKTRESLQFGMKNENFSTGTVRYVGHEIRAVIMNKLELDSSDCVCIVSGESIVIEASMIASEGVIIAAEKDAGSLRSMRENIEKFGVHNVEIIEEVSQEALAKLPTPRLAFLVATKRDIESDLQAFLKINSKIQFVIYTLELDVLVDIKHLLEKYGIRQTEVMQIAVSKVDSHGQFVAQPSPWLISAEA